LRRVLLNVTMLLIGAVCLAVTWYYEPPIRYRNPLGPHAKPRHKPAANHYLRVMAGKNLNLRQMTLRLKWDGELLGTPQVLRGQLTREIEPEVEIKDNLLLIHLASADGQPVAVKGKGPLLRLLFPRQSGDDEVPADAVSIQSAIGVNARGRKVTVKHLRLVPMESGRRTKAAAQPPVSEGTDGQ